MVSVNITSVKAGGLGSCRGGLTRVVMSCVLCRPSLDPQVFRSLQFDDILSFSSFGATCGYGGFGCYLQSCSLVFCSVFWSKPFGSLSLGVLGVGVLGPYLLVNVGVVLRTHRVVRRARSWPDLAGQLRKTVRTIISRVGSWLLVCQNVLWQHKDEHGGG